jgi:hypothetical protein
VQWENVMSAVSAGIGAVAVVSVSYRRWLVRQVQSIVDTSVADVLRKQSELEDRIMKHLTRQDVTINRIFRKLP